MIVEGDCIEYMRTQADGSFDAVIADPPYGIDYQSARRTDKTQWKPKIANDKAPFTAWLAEAFRVLKTPAPLLCFTRYDTEEEFRQALKAAGFVDKAQVIWDKAVHGMGDLAGDFAPQHENIIFATKGRFTFPGTRPKSVLRFPRIGGATLSHPNEKPLALMGALVSAITSPGQRILDPFSGSGVVASAARKLGREVVAVELDPKYVDLSRKRLESAQ